MEFRKMRRFKQELTQAENEEVLANNTSGVLALLGDEDYPYALPLSYVYWQGNIYFHSALDGHKIEAINKHDKASFCVIDQDDVIPEMFTTKFRSVIAFGKIRIVSDMAELRPMLEVLAKRYTPNDDQGIKKEIDENIMRTAMIELKVEHLSGKASKR